MCSLIPEGGEKGSPALDDFEVSYGFVGKCTSIFEEGQISILLFDDPAKAQKEVATAEAAAQQQQYAAGAITDLGDANVEVRKDQSPPGNSDSPVLYQITFRHGCFVVFGNAGGIFFNYVLDAAGEQEWITKRDWARSAVADVYARLKPLPPCPSSITASGTELAGSLGVSLECQHNFEDPGLAVCTASATNPRDGAAIVYDWSFDGTAQAGVAGTELELHGVGPGDHTVTVVARDDANGLTSGSQSVSFTKASAGQGDGGSNLIPILIAAGAAAGVGIGLRGLARRRRGKPTSAPAGPPTPPAREQPAAAPGNAPVVPPRSRPATKLRPPVPPPSAPPEKLPPAKPRTTPEPAAPPLDPRLDPSAKPRGSAPPAAPPTRRPSSPTAAQTAPPSKRPQDDKKKEGQLWLEADCTSITIRGNTKDQVEVHVRAFKQVGGQPVDASNEVEVTVEASNSKKIYIRPLPGYCNFSVHGAHIGSTPYEGKLTLSGVSTVTHERARPLVIPIHVDPGKVEFKITAWKKGFLEQHTIVTLPYSCRRIEGFVEGGDPVIPASQPVQRGDVFINVLRRIGPTPQDGADSLRVLHGHCSASMRIDDGSWSNPVRTRTGDAGGFWFTLPQKWTDIFGVDSPTFVLPRAIELGLDNEVKQALSTYNRALEDLQKESQDVPPTSEFGMAREACAGYPWHFLKQLREREEEDYPRLLAALNLLCRAVFFSAKARKDFKWRRGEINSAAKGAFGSVLDVVTDYLPVAMGFYGWVGGKAFTIRGLGWKVPGLPDLIQRFGQAIEGVRGGRLVLKIFNLFVRAFAAVAGSLNRTLGAFFHALTDAAERRGLPTDLLLKLADTANPYAPGSAARGEGVVGEILTGLVGSLLLLLACGWKFLWGLVVILLLLACLGIKLVAPALKAFLSVFGIEGAGNTLGERIEEHLGNWAGDFYDALGGWIDWARGLLGLEPSGVSSQDACELIMDRVLKVEDLDAVDGPLLLKAYRSSMDLNVPQDWKAAAERVSREEREIMRWRQDRSEWRQLGEWISPFLKLAAKIVQAFAFSAGVFAEGVLRVATALGDKVLARLGDSDTLRASSIRNYVRLRLERQQEKKEGFFEGAGKFEMIMDVLDAAVIKVPIFLMEVIELILIYHHAPKRLEDLYR